MKKRILAILMILIMSCCFSGCTTEGEEEACKKPVIYLYPEEETQVKVNLNYKGKLTTTYPTYQDGWNVIAQPDGTLTNLADHKTYSYLFWEGLDDVNYDFSKGAVVAGKDTAEFLQTTLSKMGLTPKEYNEFIVYWLPEMENNAYNLISFQGDTYTDRAELEITPKPDSVLRVFMAWKPLKQPMEIEPQIFSTFARKGFTVVEWGGTEMK